MIRHSNALFLIVAASLASMCTDCRAQQLAIGPPPKVRLVGAGVPDVSRRLGALGYSKIALNVVANRIEGTAMRDGRAVRIDFDERGQLHILQTSARKRSQ